MSQNLIIWENIIIENTSWELNASAAVDIKKASKDHLGHFRKTQADEIAARQAAALFLLV